MVDAPRPPAGRPRIQDPDEWRPRSDARRRASAAKRRKQRRKVVALAVVLVVALVALVALGVAWGARALSGIMRAQGARLGAGGASDGRVGPGTVTAGGSASRSGAAGSEVGPIGPPPASIISIRPTERVFTPSTIRNPFGRYKFKPETRIRVATRSSVRSVKVVAIPPAAYGAAMAGAASASDAGTGGGSAPGSTASSSPAAATTWTPVPVTMVYKGPLKKGVTLLPWTGQTKDGYALPRGIYRVRMTVLAHDSDAREVGRSAETTAHLISFVTIGNRENGLVALTVDDGWNADKRVFDLLKREKVPATAFFIGGRGVVDQHPELVGSAMDAGMEIANHSWDHAWLIRYADEKVMWTARKGQQSIQRVSGYDHHWFRPSGGVMDPRTMAALYRAGSVPVQWSVDTEDTNGRRTVAQRVATTMEAVRALGSGTIILCHFGGHGTYDVLSQVIPQVRAMGLRFGTMSEVMAGTPGFTDRGPAPPMVAPDPPS